MHISTVEVERSGGKPTFVSSHFYDLRQLGHEVREETKRGIAILDLKEGGSRSLEVVREAERIVYDASVEVSPVGEKVRLSRKTYTPDKALKSAETATLLFPDVVSLDRPPKVTFSSTGPVVDQDRTHLATSPHALLSTHDLLTDYAIASNWKPKPTPQK